MAIYYFGAARHNSAIITYEGDANGGIVNIDNKGRISHVEGTPHRALEYLLSNKSTPKTEEEDQWLRTTSPENLLTVFEELKESVEETDNAKLWYEVVVGATV